MDRESLEQLLNRGLSLAEIGRRFQRHEATVSYWVKKYGLAATNQARHAGRGGLGRSELEALVEQGMTIAAIAESLGRSKATVRHWLGRYGLKTQGKRGRRPSVEIQAARQAGMSTLTTSCGRHGDREFVIDGRGSTAAGAADPSRSPADAER